MHSDRPLLHASSSRIWLCWLYFSPPTTGVHSAPYTVSTAAHAATSAGTFQHTLIKALYEHSSVAVRLGRNDIDSRLVANVLAVCSVRQENRRWSTALRACYLFLYVHRRSIADVRAVAVGDYLY